MWGDTFFDIFENKEMIEILENDDKERFLQMLSAHAHEITASLVGSCAYFRAKKCLLATIEGEGCEPALEVYARTAQPDNPQIPTPLMSVIYNFFEAYDIIELLLKRGPVNHPNIKCKVFPLDDFCMCPIERLLFHVSQMLHMSSWDHCTSVIKLIILLCQWETKSRLDAARLLVPHTNGLNNIAWSYVMDGNLVSFAALLLVAQEKVLLPFDSGLTIQQRIRNTVDILSSEGDLDHDGAAYKSMLIDACKLIDIFKRAGGALSLYCSLMHEYVPPHKVLADVASVLKMAGYALEPRDLDLRDCYRACPELKRASVFKLAGPESPNYKWLSPSSLTRPQGFGAAIQNYPYRGNCPLFNKVKSGPVLSFRPFASEPRLLSTVAVHVENGVSGVLQKHMAYIAFRLKRGIKF